MKQLVALFVFLISVGSYAGTYAPTYSPKYSCSQHCSYAGPNLTDKNLACCDACKAKRANQ